MKIEGYEIGIRADLYRADLRGADLYRADLRGADLYRADLYRADLREANLRGADLREANLRGADLYRADLRGAKGILKLPVSDPRFYEWVAFWFNKQWIIKSGCRCFTQQEARDHWLSDCYEGPLAVKETIGFALDWLTKQGVPK